MKAIKVVVVSIFLFCLLGFSVDISHRADLVVSIRCPSKATPGQALAQSIQVWVRNMGKVRAGEFAVELVLSTDRKLPLNGSTYRPGFVEDVRLLGGWEKEKGLDANKTLEVTLRGANVIPADTPPGTYYLGVIVDPERVVPESNDLNNISTCKIIINKK